MLNESYWTYRVERPPDTPPPDHNMTQKDWYSLTPGMRREIWRCWYKKSADLFAPLNK